jgi:hypothetical protein
MKLCDGWMLAGLLIGFGSASTPAQQRHANPPLNLARIFVDHDVRVSHDGDVVHMETYVSASATNSDLLLAGGEVIFSGRRANATEAQIYRSADAGARWTPVLLPDEVVGGWDNAIVSGPDGVAYFLTSNLERGLTVYRSTDGGVSWISTVLRETGGWDRPHVVVDNTASAFRGSFYVAGEADDGVRLVRSRDGGKTFSPPVTACPHPKDWNAATTASPLVLSDGTLIVPCLPYPNYPERATWVDADVGMVRSRDGGRTFSSYQKMLIVHRASTRQMYKARARGLIMLSGNFMQGPSFAVAPPTTQFADRIYAVWQDIDATGGSRLLVTHSADGGETWSAAVPVNSARDRNGQAVQQGVPMVAVSQEGILGVAWFDGRLSQDGKGYDVYFTASVDGGATFLPAVRVSTITSTPGSGLNILPALDVKKSKTDGKLQIRMTSPFSDRATGGDYSSMAADAAGRFHPLWADARSGAWQVYTSTIRVLSDDLLHNALSQGSCPVDSSRIELLFDEPTWDGKTNDLAVPVRILNSSPNPIINTIVVRVKSALSDESWMKLVPDPESLTPKLLDDSLYPQDHSLLEYQFSPASPLFPNSASAPLRLHLRVPSPDFINFSFDVETIAEKCPQPPQT